MAKKTKTLTPTLGAPITPLAFSNDVFFAVGFSCTDLVEPITEPKLSPRLVVGTFEDVSAHLHPELPNYLVVTGKYVSGLKLVDNNNRTYAEPVVHADAISGRLSITVKSGGRQTNDPTPKATYKVL